MGMLFFFGTRAEEGMVRSAGFEQLADAFIRLLSQRKLANERTKTKAYRRPKYAYWTQLCSNRPGSLTTIHQQDLFYDYPQ
jgi:hypothetical protein